MKHMERKTGRETDRESQREPDIEREGETETDTHEHTHTPFGYKDLNITMCIYIESERHM